MDINDDETDFIDVEFSDVSAEVEAVRARSRELLARADEMLADYKPGPRAWAKPEPSPEPEPFVSPAAADRIRADARRAGAAAEAAHGWQTFFRREIGRALKRHGSAFEEAIGALIAGERRETAARISELEARLQALEASAPPLRAVPGGRP